MQCPICKTDKWKNGIKKRWVPRIGFVLTYLFLVIVFFFCYGMFSEKYGSDNVMPVFVGLTPFVIGPLIYELKRKIYIKGIECARCGKFIKTKEATNDN